MKFRYVSILLLVAASSAASAAPAPLQPFRIDYQVLRNGKELGHSTYKLRDGGNGNWEFVSETHGTAGMAAMLGIDVTEKSTFRWNGNRPQCLNYSYSQKGGLKSRELSVDCDWKSATATTNDKGKTSSATLDGPAMDRHLVTLALMADLKSGATDLDYRVVDKDKIAEQRFSQTGTESLSLPIGNVQAVKIARSSDDGKRQTASWFAPLRGWLPVQIEQTDKNGETITLRQLPGSAR
jgi:hypothetical protein